MTSRLSVSKTIGAALLLLASASAVAVIFAKVDASGDDEITRQEFTQNNLLQQWDNNVHTLDCHDVSRALLRSKYRLSTFRSASNLEDLVK